MRLYAQLRDIDRMILVHFEDLVTRGNEQAKRVCAFLDLPYDLQMLEFYKQDLVALNASRMPEWEDLQKPLMPDNVGRFRDELSETEIRFVEALCAEEMAFFGYEREFESIGNIEQLEAALPNERLSDRVLPEGERVAKDAFREGVRRIEGREVRR